MTYKNILLKYILVVVTGLWIIPGCNIINPTEATPTYIHIDSFKFVKGLYSDISYSNEITAVWVYYNNSSVGEFDLPATIPIIASGSGTLEVSPAVRVNGMNSQMQVYPFYTIDTFTFNAAPGQVINHVPITQYYTGLKFHTICNQYNLGLAKSYGTVGITFVGSDSLEFTANEPCAGVFMNNSTDSSIDSSIVPFNIDAGSAFIELNYKCTVPFYLGLQATINGVETSTPYYLIGVFPNGDVWKKFYLDVGGFNSQYGGSNYKLFIKANMQDGQTNGKLLLDNVQLVNF